MRKLEIQEKAGTADPVVAPAGVVAPTEKPPINPKQIALCFPCGGPVEPDVAISLAGITYNVGKYGYEMLAGMTNRVLIHSARNILADNFLKSTAEWSFWMDSDMILEPRTVMVMLNWAAKLDAKMLTGVYYQRNGKHRPVVMARVPGMAYKDDYTHHFIIHSKGATRPYKAAAAGFGCMLIHREVFEKMKRPHFRHVYMGPTKEASEDFYFCSKARKLGYPLWVIPELDCGHIGSPPVIRRDNYEEENEGGDLQQIQIELAPDPSENPKKSTA